MDKITLGPRPIMFPMPTVLVGALVDGKPNYMTVAWCGIAGMAPPCVAVAINHSRHTLKGIKHAKMFSVNVPSTEHVVETDYCGLVSGSKADKSEVFETFYGKLKAAPMIKECPVSLECEVFKTVDCGSHELVIGKIVEVYADKDCMSDDAPDITKVDPIIYASSSREYYHIGEFLADGFAAGKAYKNK